MHMVQQGINKAPNKTLIVVAGEFGDSMTIAQALGQRLRRRGHVVEVGDALAHSPPSPEDFQAVIIGTEPGQARDRRALGDYIGRHRAKLENRATGLFIVNNQKRRRIASQVDAFASTVNWRPTFAASLEVRKRAGMRAVLRYTLRAALSILTSTRNVANADAITELAVAITRALARRR
jgi:menaquinone-dependent protoporphyrinogen IX oxidase